MPNNNNLSNLFALVEDDDAPIRRIPLTAALNTELAQLFAEQQAALLGNKQSIAFTGDAKDWKGVRKYFDLEVQGKANPLRALYEIIDGTTRDKTITANGRTFGYEYGFADSKSKRNAVDQAVACLVEQIVAA